MGGSAYYHMKNKYDINLPKPDLEEVKSQIYALTDCIDKELVLSCHDISDGGLAVALSEMSFKNIDFLKGHDIFCQIYNYSSICYTFLVSEFHIATCRYNITLE